MFRTSVLRENARVAAATYENLNGFYEKLKSIIEEYGLTAERIYNMDESFIDMNSKSKILVLKGSDYYQTIKNKPGHITLVATINAAGYSCNSLLIFQEQSVPSDIKLPKCITWSMDLKLCE